MTPIRPSVQPPIPQGQRGPEPGKLAAQRAFFAAALGQAQASAAAAAPPTAAPATATRAAAATAEASQKILRPGSLIDIRV